jgi:DNA-binding transcriptional MerR regulator
VKSNALGPDSPIPDKLYFKIGEVAKLVGVQAHVLRYWQSEIPAIRPSKSTSNQRRYRYKDVEIFREIRRLLYEERYTLAGARRRILTRETGPAAPGDLVEPPASAGGETGVAGAPAGEGGRAPAVGPAAAIGSGTAVGSGAAIGPTAAAGSASATGSGVAAGSASATGSGVAAGSASATGSGVAAGSAATTGPSGAPAPAGPAPHPQADVVALPQRPPPPAARPRSADEPREDDELVQRLRRGLKDLIRLAGEEP